MEDEVPAGHEHSGQQRQGEGSGLAAELRDGTACSSSHTRVHDSIRGLIALRDLPQVKYYNAEEYEVGRFEEAILKYQVPPFSLRVCVCGGCCVVVFCVALYI